jgi:hypothetical protein
LRARGIAIADEVRPHGDFHVGSFLDSEGDKLWFRSSVERSASGAMIGVRRQHRRAARPKSSVPPRLEIGPNRGCGAVDGRRGSFL